MTDSPKRKLRRQLVVKASDGCSQCGGSGLRVENQYYAGTRRLEVTIDVCPCVKVTAV
jgi:hypothetical protein